MDFVSDALFDDRRLRALTVVDAFPRQAPAIEVGAGWPWRGGLVERSVDSRPVIA